MIRLEHVTKYFGNKKVLNDLCLSVPKGSIYGLMGLNGAGKTTIIKHLAGFLKQDEGVISIDNEPVLDNEELKQRMQIIPDELFFFKNYSLIEMGAYYKHVYNNFDESRFNDMISDFGLDPKGNIGKFSKGMKKQAAFALAMSAKPDYLVLDEPVDGLDPIVRHKLWKYIMADVADREMTVLVSSHNAKEMEDVCNYIGLIKDGCMIFEGDLLEVGDTTLEQLFIEKIGGEAYEK